MRLLDIIFYYNITDIYIQIYLVINKANYNIYTSVIFTNFQP